MLWQELFSCTGECTATSPSTCQILVEREDASLKHECFGNDVYTPPLDVYTPRILHKDINNRDYENLYGKTTCESFIPEPRLEECDNPSFNEIALDRSEGQPEMVRKWREWIMQGRREESEVRKATTNYTGNILAQHVEGDVFFSSVLHFYHPMEQRRPGACSNKVDAEELHHRLFIEFLVREGDITKGVVDTLRAVVELGMTAGIDVFYSTEPRFGGAQATTWLCGFGWTCVLEINIDTKQGAQQSAKNQGTYSMDRHAHEYAEDNVMQLMHSRCLSREDTALISQGRTTKVEETDDGL